MPRGALALGLVLLSCAAAPYSFDAVPGRLPKDMRPLDYRIDIVPDTATMSIAGRETVLLEFRSATATIRFNSLHETLRDVRLDGRPVRGVVSDDAQQQTTVTLPAPAAAGRHRLSFRYRGRIEAEPHGLFVQPYRDAGGRRAQLLSTQMEATDARRMFPCWDEPAFRATFRLRMTQPAGWAAIGNMPVSDAACTAGSRPRRSHARRPCPRTWSSTRPATSSRSRPARLACTRRMGGARGQEQSAAAALANARTILADYNDYFGYPYPLPKLDSIAIPGGWDGAMENWGAITFADNLLLYTPASTLHNAQDIFSRRPTRWRTCGTATS